MKRDTAGDLVLRLRSTDDARRAAQSAGMRFSANKLRALGHDAAALALDMKAHAICHGVPDELPSFDEVFG